MTEEYVSRHISLKNYPAEARPRDKMAALGPELLSDQELLAILLRTGTKEVTALDLAQEILAEGGLNSLDTTCIEELSKRRGIGLAKAAQLKAAIELGKRLFRQKMGVKPVISSPIDAAKVLMGSMTNLDREYFKIMLLTTKNQVISVETISIGNLNTSLVHPREVFKIAIKKSAASIILVHNHPSGDCTPSTEDISITRRLIEAGELLNIKVLDHLIMGCNNFISMKEKGLI